MSMKIALAFLMLAPALAQESTCSGEGGGQCEGSSASPMVDEQVLLQASVSMHSQLDLQSESARMSAVKRCSLSLISKATKTKANPSGCEEFGADLEKTVTDETIPAIKSGVGNDQKMHDLAEGGVNKCNEALSANSNLVANGANDVDVARKLHIECRSVEATHFDTSEAKSQALTSFLGSPQDPCGGTYPNQWKALAECFETQVNYHKQMNTTLYEKVEAYTKAHDEWQAKKDECTTSQAHFEVTYCGRHHLVENTIKNYDQCWEEATQSYEAVKVAVTASFDNHVKEYIAAQRLICLAKATKLTEEPTKAQAQLDHCHNMEVDTSELTLNIPADFPPEKNKVNFGDMSVYPGHPNWVGQEYAGLSAAKSPHAAVTPCESAAASSTLSFNLKGDTGEEQVTITVGDKKQSLTLTKSFQTFTYPWPADGIYYVAFTNDGKTAGGVDKNVRFKGVNPTANTIEFPASWPGWKCGSADENTRCDAVRSGTFAWNGQYTISRA